MSLTTTQRVPILVEGEPLASGANVESDDTTVATIANVTKPEGSFMYVVGKSEGSAGIHVTLSNGRTGVGVVTVTLDPLEVTFGAPEPKA